MNYSTQSFNQSLSRVPFTISTPAAPVPCLGGWMCVVAAVVVVAAAVWWSAVVVGGGTVCAPVQGEFRQGYWQENIMIQCHIISFHIISNHIAQFGPDRHPMSHAHLFSSRSTIVQQGELCVRDWAHAALHAACWWIKSVCLVRLYTWKSSGFWLIERSQGSRRYDGVITGWLQFKSKWSTVDFVDRLLTDFCFFGWLTMMTWNRDPHWTSYCVVVRCITS